MRFQDLLVREGLGWLVPCAVGKGNRGPGSVQAARMAYQDS